MKYIKKFEHVGMDDVALVGGKNASLGHMIRTLSGAGIRVPDGFATTAPAYWHFIDYNGLRDRIKQLMAPLTDVRDIALLKRVGAEIRAVIYAGTMPTDLASEITAAYRDLCGRGEIAVAVRSSATAEDLPGASFAGQQETFLNIRGEEALLDACKKCIASLFTDRAIVYRIEQGFDYEQIALSIGIQKMVRSDMASAGVAFSLDTETGFKDVVTIESSYGLGESLVQGLVTPDLFLVHKPTAQHGFTSIVKKKLGDKVTRLAYDTQDSGDNSSPLRTELVSDDERMRFSITDEECMIIARSVITIEQCYSEHAWTPMDVEWAKDGIDGLIYIVQARPETIFGGSKERNGDKNAVVTTYSLRESTIEKKLLVEGRAIGNRIVSGRARIVKDSSGISEVSEGDIIVTRMTDPDWVPVMKRAVGIITEQGGRTCHAAIVSRELGIPALVGAENAMVHIENGQEITLDCSQGSQGHVYAGCLAYDKNEYVLEHVPTPPISVLVTTGDPDNAFVLSALPTDGVGLARIEFIIANMIQIHPLALLYPDRITNVEERRAIEQLTYPYASPTDFFVDTLAQGIGLIAAAFYPRPVLVRFSDFKTNEYRNLIGGSYFEPVEENPMLGLRGASRYCHEQYQEAFALECKAIKKVREAMGLKNVNVMVPFVRTIAEADQTLATMKHYGLVRGQDGLSVVMMCEIPSNVLLIERFSHYFDGFSIGSNDLTQLTLGVDRDSPLLSSVFDERDPAVQQMCAQAIEGAHRQGRHIGICGQAPSDYPEFADFLMEKGIDSLSLQADAIMPFLLRFGHKGS